MTKGKAGSGDNASLRKGGAIPGSSGSGESGGGPYPNPHAGKTPKDGFMSHAGQTQIFEKPRPGETKASPFEGGEPD
jgi:hypothetical protein